jgi:hypothetical protein
MDATSAAQAHRCPRCGRHHAERRTARNFRERAAHALLGYHPYRCLDCGRRFLDYPLATLARAREAEAVGADLAPTEAAEPSPGEHAPALAITSDGTAGPRKRRRPRWIIDPGNTPLGRSEVYALVLAGAMLLLVTLAVLRFMWPESTGGVRLGAD